MIHVSKPSLGEGSILLTRIEVERALAEFGEGIANMVKEEKNPVDIPLLLIPFLEEFGDVVLDKIPFGLPPMRDMQHCIDLVPSFVLPN